MSSKKSAGIKRKVKEKEIIKVNTGMQSYGTEFPHIAQNLKKLSVSY